jgi:thiamine pyrophosphate-dependent acetolactate synthase large subunit-like protein
MEEAVHRARRRGIGDRLRFWSGEKFGEVPTRSESARYIQADATPTRIGLNVLAEVAMVGDAKLVLRQLSDAARASDWKRLGLSDWLQEAGKDRGHT